MRFLLIILLLATSFVSYGQEASAKLSDGQTIWLHVTNLPEEDEMEITGAYSISESGTLQLPKLATPILARNLNLREMQARIQLAYKGAKVFEPYGPQFHAMLAPAISARSVTISGEVERPGQLPHTMGMRLLQAIHQCGGPKRETNLTRFRIFHQNASIPLWRKATDSNPWPRLRAGDHVWVLRTGYPLPLDQPELGVQPGLLLWIRVAGVSPELQKEVEGVYTVEDDGVVRFPYIKGDIHVRGTQPWDIEAMLRIAYKKVKGFDGAKFSVGVTDTRIHVFGVVVGGEVNNPGDVAFCEGLTLRAAIAERGGISEGADMSKVKLIRNRAEIILDLRSENPLLQDGDQIVVPTP